MSHAKHAGPMGLQGNTGFATSLALLLIRLALGWVVFYHGSQKELGWFTADGQPMVEGFAKNLHLPVLPPLAWAWMASLGEFLGGTFVFLGLLTRLAALPLIVTMLVAIGTVTGDNGFSLPK